MIDNTPDLTTTLAEARASGDWAPLVRAILAHYDIAQPALGSLVGAAPRTVSGWATGQNPPSPPAQVHLARLAAGGPEVEEAVAAAREAYPDGRGRNGGRGRRKADGR